MNRSFSILKVLSVVLVATLASLLGANDAHALSIRWRADGSICMPTRDLPGQTSSNYWAKESQGLQVFANTFFRCPIPVGPEYVELTDSAPHTIERIFFDYEFTGLTFNFWVNLVIISPTSNDFCECDQFDGLDVPDTFYQKQLVWDGIGNNCQGCADSNWVPMIGSAWSDRGIPVFWEVKRIMVAADG